MLILSWYFLTLFIKHLASAIKPMDELMSNHNTDSSKIHELGHVLVKKQPMEDASQHLDFIGLVVVEGIGSSDLKSDKTTLPTKW